MDEMGSGYDPAAVECPTLMTVGEYDPRSPLDQMVDLYDGMKCERELWIFANQHHATTMTGRINISERALWDFDTTSWTLDWLRDRIQGKPVERSGEVTYLTPDAGTPYGPTAKRGRTWPEALGLEATLERLGEDS
jgi:hypothetical protein